MNDAKPHDGITREMIDAATEAGASAEFRVIAMIDPAAVGNEKNLAAQKLRRVFSDPGQPTPEEAKKLSESGHFLSALWDGDLAEALYRADMSNKRLILRTFNERLIRERLVEDRGSVESANSWLQPNLERYGWDAVEGA